MATRLTIPPRDPLLFVHIPKTAGTSIRRYLAAQYTRDQILPVDTWNEVARDRLDVGQYRLFNGHFRYNFRALVPPGTKLLTVLRDPVARFVSHLRHAQLAPDFDQRHLELRGRPFADIIRDPVEAERSSNLQTRWLAAEASAAVVGARLAAEPACDVASVEPERSPNERLRVACTHLERIDFVGLVDELDRMYFELAAAMSFHPWFDYPRENVIVGTALPTLITQEDRALVRRLNEVDIELVEHARTLVRRRRIRRTVLATMTRQRSAPQSLPLEVDLVGPMPGSGWYDPEAIGPTLWRWTDATGPSTVQLVATLDARATCTISFFAWGVEGDPITDVSVNGVARACAHARGDDRLDVTFPLFDGNDGDDYCDIVFTSRPARLTDANAADKRVIGVAVFRIAVAPGEVSAPGVD